MLNIPSKPVSVKEVAIGKVINRVKEILDLRWNMGKGDLTTSPHLAKLTRVNGKSLRNCLLLQGENKQKLVLM